MGNNMESPAPESSSDTEEPGVVPPSSPNQMVGAMAAPEDAASSSLAGENSQARRFLKDLWNIVSSHRFQSIWWADDGKCIIIAENLFVKEVLGRKIFDTQSMGGFILLLSLHGFQPVEGRSSISISIGKLQAIAAAGASLGKLHFFHRPGFQRDQPELLRRGNQSPEDRERALAAAPCSPGQEDEHPRKRPADAPAATGATEEDAESHAAPSSTATEPWADPNGPSTSAGPARAKRRRKHSPEKIPEAALTPSAASPQCRSPPAPQDMEPTQQAAPGPSRLPWLVLPAPRAAPGPRLSQGQVAAPTHEEQKDSQSPAASRPTVTEPWADPDGPSTSVGPAPAQRHRTDGPENVPEAAPAPSAPSPPRQSPPAPLFFGPPPRPDWWPGPNPWDRPGVAPVPQPPPVPARPFRHCPTCYCPPNPAARHGDGL